MPRLTETDRLADLQRDILRAVPMLLIGEGTAEIQKMIIGRRLLDRFADRGRAARAALNPRS
jgi:alkylation response protein AidB-like acyl-CoA dehydrogenase